MISAQREDPSTEAVIEVSDSPQTTMGGPLSSAVSSGQAAVDSASVSLGVKYSPPNSTPTRIVNTVSFSYSSDVCQLGDPFSVRIPDPRGIYTDKFRKGQTIKLYLRNPNVAGGLQTLKSLGVIVDRERHCDQSGTVLQITAADLGWHLLNCDAPFWANVQDTSLYNVLTSAKWIDPSWGIRGVDIDNQTNRLIRQRINHGRAIQTIQLQQALGVLTHIQVEPEDKIIDHLLPYLRRINALINVSCDGYIQIWRPNYDREPLFNIELHEISDPSRNRNNVLSVSIRDSISGVYSQVDCVWEQMSKDITNDPTDQNWGKHYASFRNKGALPFFRRKSFVDGDLYSQEDAKKQAQWLYLKGLFDSFEAVYVVRGHYQKPAGATRAYWWESDQLCNVNDTKNGLIGVFYVSSVRCDRDEKGDTTVVTLRKPCLQASFGVYQRPPILKFGLVDYSGQTKENAQTVEVVR